MSKTIKNDPAKYREMSRPFDSIEATNEAIQAFFEDVNAAREKHRISDVVVLVESCYTEDGSEHRGDAQMQLGGEHNRLPMIARAYGAARESHEETLRLIIEAGRKARRK